MLVVLLYARVLVKMSKVQCRASTLLQHLVGRDGGCGGGSGGGCCCCLGWVGAWLHVWCMGSGEVFHTRMCAGAQY